MTRPNFNHVYSAGSVRDSDHPKPAAQVAAAAGAATASAAGTRKTNDICRHSTGNRRTTEQAARELAEVAPSSQLWLGIKDPRIVRVSRAMGGKDRHSKVSTVRGLRDRRVRLSVQTAIQVYDLQERLGLTQPSKVVDWLLDAAQKEIDKLPPLNFPLQFPHVGNSGGNLQDSRYSSISTTLRKEDERHHDGRGGGRGVHPSKSTAVSYPHLAVDHNILSNGLNSVMTAEVQPKPAGSYSPVTNNGYYKQLQEVAPAELPSRLSLLAALGEPNFHTSSTPQGMLSFYTPGTIAMIHAQKLQEDHFHSPVVCSTTATGATSPATALQSYLPSTNSDSFPAAAVAAPPTSIGRLLS